MILRSLLIVATSYQIQNATHRDRWADQKHFAYSCTESKREIYSKREKSAARVSIFLAIFEPCLLWRGLYGVATVSRIDKIIGLFCKRDLYKRRYSAEETYKFIDPTDRSHPIPSSLSTCTKERTLRQNVLGFGFLCLYM